MKKSKIKSVLIFLVASLSVIAIAFGLLTAVSKPNKEMEITVLKADIVKNTKIKNDMLTTIFVSENSINKNSVKNSEDIIGKYALTDLYESDILNKNNFSELRDDFDTYLLSLGSDKNAISITLSSIVKGVSGHINVGDVVSVLYSKSGSEGVDVSKIDEKLQYVKVVGIFNALGNEIKNTDYTESTNLPVSVALEVTKEQALLLNKYETSGQIHLMLVYRGTEEECNTYLEMQESYLAN